MYIFGMYRFFKASLIISYPYTTLGPNPGDSPSATDLILLSLLNSPILLRSSLVLNTLDVSWIYPPENFQAFVSGN